MAAALLVTLAVAVVVLGALAGSPEAKATAGRVFVLGLPIFVAAGATILPFGATWWAAVAMAVATVVGMVLARPIGAALDAVGRTASRPALAAAVLTGRSAVAVILGAVSIRWLVPQIQAVTNLDGAVVAIVVTSAAVASAVFAGGRVGLARTALIIGVVVAVLAIVAGVALGTPARSFDPVIPVAGPTASGLVMGLLAALVTAMVHPGLSRLAATRATALGRGGLAAALVGLGTLLGLMWVAGGSLSFPADSLGVLSGYIAFAPSAIGGVVAAIMVVMLTVMVSAALAAAHGPWEDAALAPAGWRTHRWFALICAGVAVVLVSLIPLSGGWLLGTLGSISVAVLIAARLAGRGVRAPEAPTPASAVG